MKLRTLVAALPWITMLAIACQQDSSVGDASRAPLDSKAFKEALAAVGSEIGPLKRIQILSATLDRVDASNVDTLREAIDRDFWWFGDVEMELSLEAWARVDPQAALAYAERWPDSERRPKAMEAVLLGWALDDPELAASEAERLSRKYPRLERQFVESILKGWAQSGRPGLIAFASQGSDASHPTAALQIAGAQTRRLGVPAVLDWADEALAEDIPRMLRLNLYRRIAGMAGRIDPVAVANWLTPHLEKPYAEGASRLLAERWVAKDAEAVIDWVTKANPQNEQENLLRIAFSRWLARDFEPASTWIRAAPPGERYDPARSSLALALSPRKAIDEAIALAAAIHDDALRQSTLQRVAASWYQRDPVAAETWLQQSELDETARTEVRRAPEKRRLRPLDS